VVLDRIPIESNAAIDNNAISLLHLILDILEISFKATIPCGEHDI
jgi:hypothetical protein